MLYVYLFHGHASCLPFSQYTILLSGTLYLGTSNCFMSTYFTTLCPVYIFHSMLFYFLVYEGTSNCLMSTYFTGMVPVYIFSWLTVLPSGTLRVETSNCCMSTHTYMYGHASCLPFSRNTIFFLAHYNYVGRSNSYMSTYFTINYFNFWYIICNNA